MWERYFRIVSVTILFVTGVLLASSVFDHFFNLAALEFFLEFRSYVANFLLALSVLFAVLNIRLSSHPRYEYWLLIMIGGIIGVLYSF